MVSSEQRSGDLQPRWKSGERWPCEESSPSQVIGWSPTQLQELGDWKGSEDVPLWAELLRPWSQCDCAAGIPCWCLGLTGWLGHKGSYRFTGPSLKVSRTQSPGTWRTRATWSKTLSSQHPRGNGRCGRERSSRAVGTKLGILTDCLQPGPQSQLPALRGGREGLWAAGPSSSRLRFWVGHVVGWWRVLWLSNVDAWRAHSPGQGGREGSLVRLVGGQGSPQMSIVLLDLGKLF